MSSSTGVPADVVRPRPLGPQELLAVWETGRRQAAADRALTILTHGLPALERETLADLPVGTRDALLLQVRELTFGDVAECLAQCPGCEATVEFPVSLTELGVEGWSGTEAVVEHEGMGLRVRPVTSRDLLALTGLPDASAMAAVLLRRCVRPDAGAEAEVPPAAAPLVVAEMARLDPGADLRFSLSCPSCDARWTVLFDVASYLWREVDAAARTLLAEVHALASAYGWPESEILRLTPARRRAYLELTGAR